MFDWGAWYIRSRFLLRFQAMTSWYCCINCFYFIYRYRLWTFYINYQNMK